MFNRLIKTRSILAIFLFALLLTVAKQTAKADGAACAQAVAEAAAALAEQQAACQNFGTASGACILAIERSVETAAAAAEACPVS